LIADTCNRGSELRYLASESNSNELLKVIDAEPVNGKVKDLLEIVVVVSA
jgi:hypothetical protein